MSDPRPIRAILPGVMAEIEWARAHPEEAKRKADEEDRRERIRKAASDFSARRRGGE